MNKRKFCFFIFCFFIIFVLSSCFDITQSISLQDNKYIIGYKCSFDKNLMYIANVDEDSYYDETDKIEEQLKSVNGNLKRIENSDELGFYFSFDCSTDTELTNDLADLLPEYKNGKIYVPFFLGSEIHNTDTNDSLDMAVDMISISKFRLLLSKSIKPELQSAQLIDATKKHPIDLEFQDFGDMFCIYVPIKTVFLSHHTYEYLAIK